MLIMMSKYIRNPLILRNLTATIKHGHPVAKGQSRLMVMVSASKVSHQRPRNIIIQRSKPTFIGKVRCLTCSSSRHQTLRPYVDPKLSYAFGRSQDHLIYSTIMKELNTRIDRDSDSLAFSSQLEGKQVSLKEFNEDVNKLAKTLITKLNIVKGDPVALYAYNCYNWLVVQFACARIGAILVPVNPSNKAKELSYVLKTSKPKCIFTHGPKSAQSELNKHLDILKSDEIGALIKSGDLSLENVILMDAIHQEYDDSLANMKVHNLKLHTWKQCLDNGRIFCSLKEAQDAGSSEKEPCIVDIDCVSPDDTFAIYYTSGTTGAPKGACVSHFGALNNAKICFGRLRQGLAKNERPVLVTTLPFFHIYAGVLLSFGPVFGDCQLISSGHKYDVKTVLKATIEHKANITALTPTILIDMLSYIEANNLGDKIALKTVQSGGAYIPPEVVQRAFQVLKNLKEVRIGYGSTENAAVATMQTIHEPDETKASSVGGPIDFTELRIVDPITDEIVPLGESGEVQTRGHNIMLGYKDQPEKTSEVITPHRWYRTGDVGVMYPHGSIKIIGRQKSLIIKGGENIYPEEVARFILHLPYVENVHVVGLPHKRYGEEVCAWIKLKPDYCEASENADPKKQQVSKQEIIKFCEENMTHFKVPRYILFVDSFPMTPTKKIQSHLMVKESIKIFGLVD